MMHYGREGYVEITRKIITAARYIKENTNFSQINVAGNPLLNIIAFESSKLNIHAIGYALRKIRGWKINHCSNPSRIQYCVDELNAEYAQQFVEDLQQAVLTVMQDPQAENYFPAIIYGAISTIPGKLLCEEFIKNYPEYFLTA